MWKWYHDLEWIIGMLIISGAFIYVIYEVIKQIILPYYR